MKYTTLAAAALVLCAATAGAQTANSSATPQWGPVPSVLPAGAQIEVLHGNPFGSGEYTLRLRMPDGYVVPPHFHPTDENLTIISGTLGFGHGDAIDRGAMTTLHAGDFTSATAGMHHYVVAQGETVVQVHGVGPFAITYVNPTDDPHAKKTQ